MEKRILQKKCCLLWLAGVLLCICLLTGCGESKSGLQGQVSKLDTYLSQEDAVDSMSDVLNEIEESAGEVEADEVQSVLESGRYSSEAKLMMLESLCEGEDQMEAKTVTEIFRLILDDTLDSEVRIVLFRFAQDAEASEDVLQKLLESDESVAAQAIKEYYDMDQETATAVVLDQIQTTESEKMIKSYLYVLSSAVVDGYADKEEAISICKTFLDGGTEDTAMAAGYALGDMYDMEAMGVLLDSDVDELVKLGCVEQNGDVFVECLSGAPTAEEIAIITKAMEIYPIEDVVELLDAQ